MPRDDCRGQKAGYFFRQPAALMEFSMVSPELPELPRLDPKRRGLRLLGWGVLVLALPLALLAALMPANEYRATLGIDAVDCDGPFAIAMFAVPALLIYGAGVVLNGMRWRRRLNAVAAVLCFLICALVAANLVRATAEESAQRTECG